MSVKIIVDSTADLLLRLREKVSVVPLTVHFGDEEYVDGVTITHKMFYEKLVSSQILPSTSQATPASFETAFSQVQADGDGAVVITLSSALSGTYQSAVIAARDHENIYVVDGGSVAIGTGILTQLAVELAQRGMSAAQIAAKLEEEKQNVRIVAMVDTLEYLQRGGRVSKTAAFAGGLLNIKPILGVSLGQIQMLSKARGARQGSQLLMEQIGKAGGIDPEKPMLLGYTGTDDDRLQKFMADSEDFWPGDTPDSTVIGSVIGTHAGPGAVAVAFFKKA